MPTHRLIPALVLLSFFIAFTEARATDESVGTFRNAAGKVWIERAEAKLTAQPGTDIVRGDILFTGPDGEAGVILKDNTQISLGPDTKISIDEFMFEPREGNLGLRTRMFQGSVNYQSGTIGKLAPESVEFKTPGATLGIRGTHFMVRVDPL